MSAPLIVFDLDGTLIDSIRDLAESANELLTAQGAEPLAIDDVAAMVGDGAGALIAAVLARSGLERDITTALDEYFDIYARRMLIHTRAYEGIGDVLARLSPRSRLVVLTNKAGRFIAPLLEGLRLASYFSDAIGSDSGFPRKPDPAGLRHLMEQAGAVPATTLMVGDSRVDIDTARRAGVRACVALYGFGTSRSDFALDGDELLAHQPGDIVRLVDEFLAAVEASG